MANSPANQPTVRPSKVDHADAALLEDERARTRAFLVVSGLLAACGAVAAQVLSGEDLTRRLFVGSVVVMLIGYAIFGRHIRRPERYSTAKALVIVTVCNLSGVFAAIHYGVFSPASMCLTLPIAYFGLGRSLAAPLVASAVMGFALLVPSLAIATGGLDDPGLITAAALEPWQRLAYVALVQIVLAATFALAWTSRRATHQAVRELEVALTRADVAQAQAHEAMAAVERAQARGAAGPLTGRSLGPWACGRLLGRGASSEVYEAMHNLDGRIAAIKALRPELLETEVSKALFEREARLLARLDSPHVVQLYEVALEGRPYLAMERLNGMDLGQLLRRRGRLEPDEALKLVGHIAQALTHVHAAGFVHRDVKPSNLYLARVGAGGGERWKLLDFGVSAMEGGHSTLTAGMLVGTPAFMSPEQVLCEDLDPRSDLFSLASVAYRALTGRPPFLGASAHATCMAVTAAAPPRPSLLVPLARAVDDCLAVALAKDRGHRYPDLLAFSATLRAALDGKRLGNLHARLRVLPAPWTEQVT